MIKMINQMNKRVSKDKLVRNVSNKTPKNLSFRIVIKNILLHSKNFIQKM